MKKTKKTDLFRFVTLRSPQILTKAREDLGFIYHPDSAGSFFLSGITDGTPLDDARTHLADQAVAYTSENSAQDIKDIDSTLWEFSLWLMQNRNGMTRALIDTQTLPAVPAMPVQRKIWDELYYDVVTRSNPNIREACLQLIVAINFLGLYEDYSDTGITDDDILAKELKDLIRLATGKVILHQGATMAKSTRPEAGYSSYYYSKVLARRHEAKVAAMEVTRLKSIRSELEGVELTHKLERSAAKDMAYEAHRLSNKTKVENYKAANPSAFQAKEEMEGRNTFSRSLQGQSQELVTEETQNFAKVKPNAEGIIPDDLLSEFKFDFDSPLSDTYTAGKLSKAAKLFVTDNRLENGAVKYAVSKLDKEIKSLKKVALKSVKKRPLEFLINGISAKTAESRDNDCSISFNPILREDGTTVYSVYLTIDTSYNNALLNGIDMDLVLDGSTHNVTQAKLISNNEDILFVELFADAPLDALTEGVSFSLSGTFELNNGRDFSLTIAANTSNIISCGRAKYLEEGAESPDLHYGINKIGVADYRRVEQELCCYVPGEVSNIENIMAREYKEKSVRKLSRFESGSETKSSQEAESESESTSSDRFEMSNEVANVLDKEKSGSLNFNAAVHGGNNTQGFNAGTGGDISFGQSTSKSDTESKNFAQDITRRALERITQKVSSKRTSKMVQEVEQRSNHGFDNRQGDKHVTGVYRWVDKVYKNRIVNYGKRLIYEFMIPEPSKFYKEAIIIKAEEEGTNRFELKGETGSEGVIPKPFHPSKYEINDASSIRRDSYVSSAALYGLNVDAPKDQFVKVVAVVSEAFGTGDGPKTLANKDLRVPQDYQCTRLESDITFRYKSKDKTYGSISVNVAGEVRSKNFGDNEGADAMSIVKDVNYLEGEVPLTVIAKKCTVVSVSAEANCELKRSIYEQWQQDVYGAILNEYENQLKQYNDAMRAAAEEEAKRKALLDADKPVDQVLKTHPKFNAEIVKNELKRLCIEMLMEPFGHVQGKSFYGKGTEDIPQLSLGEDLDAYSSQVKFFEQAFDWDIMAQKFYPYYWAKKSDWKALFQAQDGLDYIFQAFLQSGMSRVMIPVREGFEDAVTYYMETGDIWNGSGLVVSTSDKLYLSIVDEVTDTEGIVEGSEWETIVPSTLNVLQGKSVLLDEGGLPCCESHGLDPEDQTFLEDTNVLNAIESEIVE